MKKFLNVFLLLVVFAVSVRAEKPEVERLVPIEETVARLVISAKNLVSLPLKKKFLRRSNLRNPVMPYKECDAEDFEAVKGFLASKGFAVDPDSFSFSRELLLEVQVEKVVNFIDNFARGQLIDQIKKSRSEYFEDYKDLGVNFLSFLQKTFDPSFLIEENIDSIMNSLDKLGYAFHKVEDVITFYFNEDLFQTVVSDVSELFEEIGEEVVTRWSKVKVLLATRKGKVVVGGVIVTVVGGIVYLVLPDGSWEAVCVAGAGVWTWILGFGSHFEGASETVLKVADVITNGTIENGMCFID